VGNRFQSLISLALVTAICLFTSIPVRGAQEEPANIDELIKIVQSGDSNAYLAAEALGHLGPKAKSARDALVKSLESKDDRLRIASGLALANIDLENEETAKLVVKTLIGALADEDANVRREALRAISSVRKAQPEELKIIAKALADSDRFVALHATEALASLGERGVPLLSEATKNPKTAMWALLALETIGPKAHEAQDQVIALLKDKDTVLQEQAALTLSKIAPDAKKSIPALLPLLDSEVLPVRAAAAFAIAQFGPDASGAVAKFQKMTKDGDIVSRLIGARGLIAVARPRGAAAKPLVEIMISGLEDERPGVRRESAVGLGKLGVDAASATDALTKATEDKVEGVKLAAEEALKAIKSGKSTDAKESK